MSYRIQIAAAAVADMETIASHIAEASPEASERMVALVENAIGSLVDFPKRYALAPEAATHGKEVRQMIVGRYRVLFMVIMETVHILRVRHTAQAPLKPGELN